MTREEVLNRVFHNSGVGMGGVNTVAPPSPSDLYPYSLSKPMQMDMGVQAPERVTPGQAEWFGHSGAGGGGLGGLLLPALAGGASLLAQPQEALAYEAEPSYATQPATEPAKQTAKSTASEPASSPALKPIPVPAPGRSNQQEPSLQPQPAPVPVPKPAPQPSPSLYPQTGRNVMYAEKMQPETIDVTQEYPEAQKMSEVNPKAAAPDAIQSQGVNLMPTAEGFRLATPENSWMREQIAEDINPALPQNSYDPTVSKIQNAPEFIRRYGKTADEFNEGVKAKIEAAQPKPQSRPSGLQSMFEKMGQYQASKNEYAMQNPVAAMAQEAEAYALAAPFLAAGAVPAVASVGRNLAPTGAYGILGALDRTSNQMMQQAQPVQLQSTALSGDYSAGTDWNPSTQKVASKVNNKAMASTNKAGLTTPSSNDSPAKGNNLIQNLVQNLKKSSLTKHMSGTLSGTQSVGSINSISYGR